jgi:hypothetical protein
LVWDIIIYLQTQTFHPDLSSTDRRRIQYQARQYIILGDTLYRRGVDSIFRRCLTYDEAEKALNECHLWSMWWSHVWVCYCPKDLTAGYFWPSLFKDCITSSKNVMLSKRTIIK